MIAFRQADPRYPFLWESSDQPAGRWHGPGEGPAHYFADTPDGAWAELLRHEEITDPEDLTTIRRALWAVEIGDRDLAAVELPSAELTGGPESWPACQRAARTLRTQMPGGLTAVSAALRPGSARGWQVSDGQHPAEPRDGRVIVLFGPAPELVGWRCVEQGSPPAGVLASVRHYRRR
jgi:hypothetical protein